MTLGYGCFEYFYKSVEFQAVTVCLFSMGEGLSLQSGAVQVLNGVIQCCFYVA